MTPTPRSLLLSWATSGGFAATHAAGAGDGAIVDDLLAYLAARGWALTRSDTKEKTDMSNITALPTLRVEIDKSVRAKLRQLTEHVESGEVAGLAIALTFRDGRSLTFSSGCESRREMMGLMLDSLLDFAKKET
jgi:hypothetical protein